ncbi:MAG: EF-hand domain-containing protein [Pseudomonadota bacterium]
MASARITVCSAVLLAFAAGVSPAAAEGFVERRIFNAVDQNADGRLSEAEIFAARAGRFARLDLDGDGFVSSEELEEASQRARRLVERADPTQMMRLDADGDQRLSQTEFVERPGAPGPAQVDADGDGFISRAEFDALLAAMQAR